MALHYLATHPERLDSYQMRFITGACDNPYSFFQVTDTDPGKELMLRDILLQQEVTVKERQSSTSLQKGNILFTRVVTLDGDSVMLGCAPVMIPGRFFDQIVGFRQEMERRGIITRQTLCDFQIELRGVYFDLREECLHPGSPHIESTDGDPLQMTKIHYDLHCSVNEALTALLPLTQEDDPEEFRREAEYDDQGEMVAIGISWVKMGNERHPQWGNTILGYLEIKTGRLTASINSQNRAEMLEAEIGRLLGNRAELKNREIESLGSLREGSGERPGDRGSSPRDKEHEELMADPEIQVRLKEMADEHWRTWPDIPLPALGGITPREAAKTQLGREKLEALLLDFEGRADGPEVFTPDCKALRKELGI